MKKLILILVLCLISVSFARTLTNSADNYRNTFLNGYALSGNIPQDKMKTWLQEMETTHDDFYTTPLTNVTDGSTTLTSASSGFVLIMGTTGEATPTVTLPAAVAGEHYTIIDNSGSETVNIITSTASDTLRLSGATSTIQSQVADKGTITLLAIRTASVSNGTGTWAVTTSKASWTND